LGSSLAGLLGYTLIMVHLTARVNSKHRIIKRRLVRDQLFSTTERFALIQRLDAVPLTLSFFSVTLARGQFARLILSIGVVLLPILVNLLSK